MFVNGHFTFFAPEAAKPKPFPNTSDAKDLYFSPKGDGVISNGCPFFCACLPSGSLSRDHLQVSGALSPNFQVPKARLTGFHPRYRPLIDDSRMARAFSLTRRCLVSRQTIVPRSSPLKCGALHGRIPLKAKRTVDKALELRVLSAHPLE